jgi:hypothetical protein
MGDNSQPESMQLDDIIRFNEAIDQALAESGAFSARKSIRHVIYFMGCLDMTCTILIASYLAALKCRLQSNGSCGPLINSGRFTCMRHSTICLVTAVLRSV